jgi:hypothetical protein
MDQGCIRAADLTTTGNLTPFLVTRHLFPGTRNETQFENSTADPLLLICGLSFDTGDDGRDRVMAPAAAAAASACSPLTDVHEPLLMTVCSFTP